MADDIDIEEHDVLDNPAVKKMFPDMSAFKLEIENYEGIQESDTCDLLAGKHIVTVDEDLKLANFLLPITNDLIIDLDDDDDDNGVDDIHANNSQTSVTDKAIISSKIILGSKPNRSLEFEEDFFEKQVKSYDVNVVLDDLNPYLRSSGRFCNECLILFPNKSGLDIHNMNSHDVAKESTVTRTKKRHGNKIIRKRFKCTKCNVMFSFPSSLYRHNQRFHRGKTQRLQEIILKVKNRITNRDLMEPIENNKCFHCKRLFRTQKSLIEHLYNILQYKKYSCKVCSQKFRTNKELDQHMVFHKKCVIVLKKEAGHSKNKTPIAQGYKMHNDQNRRTLRTDIKKATVFEAEKVYPDDVLKTTEAYYRCYICSYYFTQTKFCLTHLANKHNVTSYCQDMEKKEFDAVCKYCSKNYDKMHSFNRHLIATHEEYVNSKVDEQCIPNRVKTLDSNTIKSVTIKLSDENEEINSSKVIMQNTLDEAKVKSFVLKTALFKCTKCDIHFLSSKTARNHIEHMDMLINWKCINCKRIFKNEDKDMHEKQHECSEKITVYDLCPVESSPVLYNCSKCTVHFDEESFLKHQLTCESEPPDSVFCIICDILIDNFISKAHRSEHVSRNLKPIDFIIVDSDILLNYEHKENAMKAREFRHVPVQNQNETLKRKSNESSDVPKKKEKYFDDLLTLTYCNTCKCFLTNSFKSEVHIEQRCQQLVKYICNICGLVLTAQSFKTEHKNVHNTKKNVKLQDFRFYDLNSGQQICPPAPEYPKCENCDVHFTSQNAVLSHECIEIDYLTCHLCDIHLSEDAFKLHMLFHNYSKSNVKTIPDRTSVNMQSQPNNKAIKKSGPQYSKKKLTSVQKANKQFKPNPKNGLHNGSTKIVKQSKKEPPPKSFNWNFNKKSIETNGNDSETKYPNRQDKRQSNLPSQSTEINYKVSETCDLLGETKLLNINLEGIVYQCKSCCISVDTYDKVIEHCQGHYCNEEENIETVECSICNLTFDRACFQNHQNLHLSYKNQRFFTVLNYDTFYFTSENRIWIEHVFGTLTQEQKDKIIQESIYKYECRIKIEVIQNGPADLTVYKCDKCRSFIGETSLYKHAENSCFKLRKHSCSVCGLPFNASVSRIEHEKIHAKPNINFKSYRIVTFNKEEDKLINKLLYRRSQYYALYQCRNCSVACDKSQTKNHKCSGRNLKTCLACGLLFVNEDYDDHILRHKNLPKFIQKNLKIILFGDTQENNMNVCNEIVSSFSGIVYDYTFYSCSECQVCLKSIADLEKHTCCLGANKLKCSRCKLYFLTSKLKHHVKLHEIDPDFVRSNMRVIIFNSSQNIMTSSVEDEDVKNTRTAVVTVNKSNNNINSGSQTITIDTSKEENTIIELEEKYAKIFKCFCGLHFLEHLSLLSHIKKCDPKSRTAKQKCTKCDLLFTSDILFNHLIIHHGNKLQIYKFNIIDMAKSNIIYQCPECYLHFCKVGDINEHLQICDGTTTGKDCIFCNLKFESISFITHDCKNVKNINAGVEVIKLIEPLLLKASRESEHDEINREDLDMQVSMPAHQESEESMPSKDLQQLNKESDRSIVRVPNPLNGSKLEEMCNEHAKHLDTNSSSSAQEQNIPVIMRMEKSHSNADGDIVADCDSTSGAPLIKQTPHWKKIRNWRQQPYRPKQHFQRPYRPRHHFQRPYGRHFNQPFYNAPRMPPPNPYYH